MLEGEATFKSEPIPYIPPLRFRNLTPFFDALLKWAANEGNFKPRLIEQAGVQKNSRVLDLGCGTATLTILVKKSHHDAEVTGIDIDPAVLEIAKEKTAKAGVGISFDLGSTIKLPYPDNHFTRVVSSMVFHHLSTENKIRTMKEVLRVLKPGGELHVADLGKPHNALMRLPSLVMKHLEEVGDNVQGLLPQMLRIAGFREVTETDEVMTMFGTVALYCGRKTKEEA